MMSDQAFRDETPVRTGNPKMIVQPSFRDSILTFFRRKFMFLLVFGAVCLAGAGYLLLKHTDVSVDRCLVLRFDQQTVPDIDRTPNPAQPLGSNERREILYSDADILRSPDLPAAIASVGLARLYPKIAADGHGEQRQMDEAVKAFTSDMVIDVGLQSDVLTLSFLNPDPHVAHAAVQSCWTTFSRRRPRSTPTRSSSSPRMRQRAQEKLAAAQTALATSAKPTTLPTCRAGQSVAAAAYRCRKSAGDGEWTCAGGPAEGSGCTRICWRPCPRC